jgi:Zn-finger protein
MKRQSFRAWKCRQGIHRPDYNGGYGFCKDCGIPVNDDVIDYLLDALKDIAKQQAAPGEREGR